MSETTSPTATSKIAEGLPLRGPRRARRERGGIVVLVAVLVTVMSVMGATMLHTAMRTANDLAVLEKSRVDAEFLGRAALDAGQRDVEVAFRNRTTPADAGEIDIAGHLLPYAITELRAPMFEQAADGVWRWSSVHGIEAQVEAGGVSLVRRRIVRVHQIPLFQYAVFYDGDLRIHPGPRMTLSGPVHTNGDLWNRSSSGLVFDTNYVRAAGDIYNWCISESKSKVEFRKWVPDPFDASAPREFVGAETADDFESDGIDTAKGGFDHTFGGHDANGDGDFDDVADVGPWAERAFELWGPATGVASTGHTVVDRTLGAKPISHNGSAEIQRFVPEHGGDWAWDDGEDDYVQVPAGEGTHVKGQLHGNADLVIDFDGEDWTARDAAGTDVTALLLDVVSVTETFNGFADEGDGEDEPTLVLDVAALGACGLHPANGLLYLGAPGIDVDDDPQHFRLTNGTELKGALSVASDAPVFVQGDYNTVDKKPAAVMADQVSLLSNAWDDSKEEGDLPRADETTYNLSVFSGETGFDASNGAEGNGGYHNVLRFHENWSGVDCHIRGSTVIPMVSRNFSTTFRGGGHFYNPPNRDFGFDPDLIADPANLPPFTPIGVEVMEIASY